MFEKQQKLEFDFSKIFADLYELTLAKDLPIRSHYIYSLIVGHVNRKINNIPSLKVKGLTEECSNYWFVRYHDDSVKLKQQTTCLHSYAIVQATLVDKPNIYIAEKLLKSDFYNECGLIWSSEDQKRLVKLKNIFSSIQDVVFNNRNAYLYYSRDEFNYLTDSQVKLFNDVYDLFYKSFVTLANVLMNAKSFEDEQHIEKFSKIVSDNITLLNEI